MKFSTTIALALAPLALGKKIANHYERRHSPEPELVDRSLAVEQLAPLGLQAGAVSANSNSPVQIFIVWYNMGAGVATQTVNQQITVTQTVTVAANGAPTTVNGADGVATTVPAGGTAVIPGAGATHTVMVGGPAGLVYTPDQLSAQMGDIIVFTFMAQNHTVTQVGFEDPCTPMPGGMDSGFVPNPNNTVTPAPQVAMQVMTTAPIWMTCSQGNHCQRGMAFSLNPTADKTHAGFQANALALFEGEGTAITGNGGAAAPPVPDPVAPGVPGQSSSLAPLPGATGAAETLPLPAGQNVVQGQGTVLPDGSCQCAVTCGSGSFPDPVAQGVGNFGGLAGSIDVNMVMPAVGI